jgi:hypothetical protein
VTLTVKVWLEVLVPSLTLIVTVAGPNLLLTVVIVAVALLPTVMNVTSLIRFGSDVLARNVNCDSGVSGSDTTKGTIRDTFSGTDCVAIGESTGGADETVRLKDFDSVDDPSLTEAVTRVPPVLPGAGVSVRTTVFDDVRSKLAPERSESDSDAKNTRS